MDNEVNGYLKVFAKSSFILMIGQMLSLFISAIGSIIVARALGAGKFGQISVAQIPISFAFLFLTNGIQSSLINFISEFRQTGENDKINSYIRAGALINFSIGFILSLIIYFSADFLSNNIFNQAGLKYLRWNQ